MDGIDLFSETGSHDDSKSNSLKRPPSSFSPLLQRDPRKFARPDQLSTARENVLKTPDWQTIPVSKQHKNLTPLINKEKNCIPLQNKFNDLPMEDISEDNAEIGVEKLTKSPPIMLYGITDVSKLMELLETVIQRDDYKIKTINNKQLRVTASSIEVYKKIINVVRDHDLIGHTFTIRQERAYRVVLKNLHFSTPTSIIKGEIEKLGHKVRGEIVNARSRFTKEPLSMFFINLEPNDNNKDIFNIRYILNNVVTFEPPRKSASIVQCKRCQQFGHTRNNCMRPFRCVKCAGAHNTSDCPKTDRNTPATCALCFEDHPANYRGCRVYKEIVDRKLKNSDSRERTIRPTRPQFQLSNGNFPLLNKATLPPIRKELSNKNDNVLYVDALKQTRQNFYDETKLDKLTNQIEMLVQQMGTLMGLLSTVVTKLCQ